MRLVHLAAIADALRRNKLTDFMTLDGWLTFLLPENKSEPTGPCGNPKFLKAFLLPGDWWVESSGMSIADLHDVFGCRNVWLNPSKKLTYRKQFEVIFDARASLIASRFKEGVKPGATL